MGDVIEFLDVIIQPEDRTCQEKRLSNVQQYAVSHGVDVYNLIKRNGNATQNEQHRHRVLYKLRFGHYAIFK